MNVERLIITVHCLIFLVVHLIRVLRTVLLQLPARIVVILEWLYLVQSQTLLRSIGHPWLWWEVFPPFLLFLKEWKWKHILSEFFYSNVTSSDIDKFLRNIWSLWTPLAYFIPYFNFWGWFSCTRTNWILCGPDKVSCLTWLDCVLQTALHYYLRFGSKLVGAGNTLVGQSGRHLHWRRAVWSHPWPWSISWVRVTYLICTKWIKMNTWNKVMFIFPPTVYISLTQWISVILGIRSSTLKTVEYFWL